MLYCLGRYVYHDFFDTLDAVVLGVVWKNRAFVPEWVVGGSLWCLILFVLYVNRFKWQHL